MTREVFISHAGDDASVAIEVCALLEKRGLKCWMAPRDVAAGSVWDEAILDAIETSRVFLLILSKSANDSAYVKNEVNRAFSERKPIVTFRIEDVMPGRSLQLYLARHHWTDAFPPPLAAKVEALATSITALLDTGATSTTATIVSVAPSVTHSLASRLLTPLFATINNLRAISRETLTYSLCALVIGAGIATLTTWNFKPAPKTAPKPVVRYAIPVPPGQHLGVLTSGDAGLALAISPDGLHIVYDAWEGSNVANSQLYLRSMDSLDAKPIPGTKGGFSPFFSPDGQWVGFYTYGKLKKVPLSGAEPQTICDDAALDALGHSEVSWSAQGALILGARGGYGSGVISQISAGDCTPHLLTHLAQGEVAQAWPEILPGGKAIIFASGANSSNWANAQIAVEAIGSGQRKNLVQGGMQPRYAPSGHLVYAAGGGLKAIPFDAKRLAVTGTSVPVMDNVMQSSVWGDAQYTFSETGTLVYVPQLIDLTTMVWVDRTGKEQPLAAPVHAYLQPRISPDGRRVAVAITEQDSEIWMYDLSRGTLGPFTLEGKNNLVPYWTPDGKYVAFVSNKEGPRNIFWQHADGSGGLERLTTSQDLQIPSSFSSNGQFLAFTDLNAVTGFDIWALRLSDRKAQPFLQTKFSEREPQFSPDGHWIAYTSNESSRYEVYVQPFPGPGGKWQISTDGGREVLWNRNGRELFYRNGSKLMAVQITTQPNFSAGTPRTLFEGDYQMNPAQSSPDYDVSADGQRFLMLKPFAQPQQINVVLNWFEELNQKAPTGKK